MIRNLCTCGAYAIRPYSDGRKDLSLRSILGLCKTAWPSFLSNRDLCEMYRPFIWIEEGLCEMAWPFFWSNRDLCKMYWPFIWIEKGSCEKVRLFFWSGKWLCRIDYTSIWIEKWSCEMAGKNFWDMFLRDVFEALILREYFPLSQNESTPDLW